MYAPMYIYKHPYKRTHTHVYIYIYIACIYTQHVHEPQISQEIHILLTVLTYEGEHGHLRGERLGRGHGVLSARVQIHAQACSARDERPHCVHDGHDGHPQLGGDVHGVHDVLCLAGLRDGQERAAPLGHLAAADL